MQWSIEMRPHTLGDVYGAEKVKTYFYNLKKQKKDFPQGILFKGFTGSGKTTSAKIVAQMLVCTNPKENGDPCCECPDCKAIIDEKYNRTVLQIDGGNSSKDEVVSTISDFIATPSFMNRPKVIMVEEAQELSSAAQKSLLKLLEIPRKNIHIILTTMTGQGGKNLPSAIINRCQRFLFSAATVQEMLLYLKSVLQKRPEVMAQMPDLSQDEFMAFLQAIALNANGSYRQGLQLLEQCIDSGVYTAQDISKEFGITDEAGFYQIMLDLLNGKMTQESFETIMNGDANALAAVFSLAYKVISDAECYRLFKRVPNVDNDNEFFMRQAREISSHPKFIFMRDTFYEFAQYEKLMPSNIRMLICRVYENCATGTITRLVESKPIVVPEVKPTPIQQEAPKVEPIATEAETPAPARRVIRRG